jgi:Spy/CpxP family protein refolding chaperone
MSLLLSVQSQLTPLPGNRRAHRIANLKDLNLTDEQKAQIMEICKEFRPKVHEAGNMLRAAIREEVEKIDAVLKG